MVQPNMRDPEVVAEWLARAQDDAQAAHVLDEAGLFALAAFHAQQAAEKALKAVAIGRGSGLDRTHDLKRLSHVLKAPNAVVEAAEFLNVFYVGGRYPDVGATATKEDAVAAIAFAKVVMVWSLQQR